MAHPPLRMLSSRLALLLVLVGILTACANTPTLSELVESQSSLGAASSIRVVTIWHTATPDQAQTLQEIADAWSRQQPNAVQVELRAFSGAESLHQELLSGIQTQHNPDLAFVRPHDLPTYADSDEILSLTPYWKSLTVPNQDDYLGAFVQANQCNSEPDALLWALPINRVPTLLYVNQTALTDELGFDALPTTWKALQTQCEAHVEESRTPCLTIVPTGETSTALFLSNANPIINAESQESALYEPSAFTTLERLEALRDERAIRIAPSHDSAVLEFARGRTLFAIDRSDELQRYTDAIESEFEWTVTALPHEADAAGTVAVGDNIALFRSTPEQEQVALSLLTYLAEPDVSTRWAAVRNALPVRQSALDIAAQNAATPQERAATALLYAAHPMPCVTRWLMIESQLTKLVSDTVNQVAPPDALLQNAVLTTNSLLR